MNPKCFVKTQEQLLKYKWQSLCNESYTELTSFHVAVLSKLTKPPFTNSSNTIYFITYEHRVILQDERAIKTRNVAIVV